MPVHIVVCIKSVVHSTSEGKAVRSADNSELNPFDRPALEAALRIKEALEGTVTALSMGPPVSIEALAEAQAMGVDRAVLINDRALAGSDTLVTSRVLAAGIARLAPFDLVLFGMRSSDSDTGQVGPQTAAGLELPFIGGIHHWEHRPTGWEFVRTMDDWEERWLTSSPAAATVLPRFFPARAIGLAGIGRALHEPVVTTWDLDDLKINRASVGLSGSPTRVAGQLRIQHQRKCKMITGEPQEQIDRLMDQLNTMGLIES